MRIKKTFVYFYLISFLLLGLGMSCSDIDTEKFGIKNDDLASRKIFNAELVRTDSVYTRIKLRAPIIEEYEYAKIPYTLFPKGIDMDFYQEGKINPGHLRADYAKIIERTGWYEAKKNVLIINPDKDTLKTEHLFWDKSNRRIFSNDTVKIYRADGVTTNISANGIEASEDFKNFKLKKNRGTLPYNNEVKSVSK